MRPVLVFDTSVLCVWLQVPGKDTCGPRNDRWDKARVDALLTQEYIRNSTFVLPLATIIETGNHISQAPGRRLECATGLMELLSKCLDEQEPWAAFAHQAELWSPARLRKLIPAWPPLAQGGLSLGDATIKEVADYYARMGAKVIIVTGDQGLKAYEPTFPMPKPPRRRQ